MWFRRKNDVLFVFPPICFVEVHVSDHDFVLIYIYWCLTRYPYQVIIASVNRNTTGVTSGGKSANPSGAPDSTPGFSGVRATRSLVFCVVFCRSLFVFVLFYFEHCFVCPLNYGFCLPISIFSSVISNELIVYNVFVLWIIVCLSFFSFGYCNVCHLRINFIIRSSL